jgi:hypothetical protein
MYASHTVIAVAATLKIDSSALFSELANQQKRERRWRNRQNDGAVQYQPVSIHGKEFYNLKQMYAGFDA